MNTPKHTPGPWKVRTAYSNGEPVCYTIHLGQTSIADVTSLSEQDRVNATLIAAAPAMYADAKQLCELVRDFMNDNRLYDGQVIQAISNLETALSQAEGRDK